MAHARLDTLVAAPDPWRHLRPFNKRKVAKAERRAAESDIGERLADVAEEQHEAMRNPICGCGDCGE